MKVNRNLLQKLKEKNINLDIDKYSKQLRTQSNAPTQVSSSEVDSMDSSFMAQSINFNHGNTQQNSNFRVRPMSAKREDGGDIMGQSQMGFSITQNSFNRKNSQKTLANNSQYQHLIDQRLNLKSSQSNRTATSSSSTIQSRDAQGKNLNSPTNGKNIIKKNMGQSFYKESEKGAGKDSRAGQNIQKPPVINNEQNPLRQSQIKERKGSVDMMTVSIYKDSKQNKIREDLLNYSGEEENFSDFNKQNDDDKSSNYSEQIQHNQNHILHQQSSKRSGFGETDDEGSEINKDVKYKEKMKRDNQFKKSSSAQNSLNHSRNTSEDKNQSKQDLEYLLEKYDRENNQDGESQNNSFDEELMILVQQEFISESITAELIEKITDVKQENFGYIRRITLCHDCEQDSLQILGELCPNLNELNINGSIVNSLRDIGTSMRNLKVLWISRVHLQDFSGLNAFPQLVELYASYNQIKNVSDLYFHENIEILDLEGNDITDNDQIEVIETMSKLKQLSLSQNPISKKGNYRQTIRQKIPQLQLLDDIPIEKDASETSTTSKSIIKRRGFPTSTTSAKQVNNIEEEEEDLYESLKKLNWNGEKFLSEEVVRDLDNELKQELNEEDLLIYSVKKTSKANKINKSNQNDTPSNLKNSNIFGQTMNNFNSTASNFRRPQIAATPKNTVMGSGNQQNPFNIKVDSISSLVEGTDQAFYGNPLKALKHKRKNDLVTTKKNDNEQDTISIPKNIVNLLDQFKQETSDDGMNKLKEELKFYDFMVEQQMSIQKKQSSDQYASNSSQNGETEQNKAKIVIKRPQIKLRTTSSNSQIKDNVPEKQLDIQQQFKELQNKSRLPVRPMLLQQKIVNNQVN